MRCRRNSRWGAACVVAALAASSCGGSEQAAPETSPVASAAQVNSEPDFVRVGDGTVAAPTPATEPVAADSQDVGEASDLTTSTVELAEAAEAQIVPETGVPGIDSEDAFCRSWSEFAGSFQALALVSAVGEAENAQVLEVLAAEAIVNAVGGLGEHLPAELETDRALLTMDFAGPMLRRSERALTELAAAGASDEDVAAYAALWLAALARVGVSDPQIAVDLATVNRIALDAAVASFAAALPSITADPSLITDAEIPKVEAYLVSNCPDQGTLLGNDIT